MNFELLFAIIIYTITWSSILVGFYYLYGGGRYWPIKNNKVIILLFLLSIGLSYITNQVVIYFGGYI